MNYELKDKIAATDDFLNELAAKSWQDIDHLQAQITNLADGQINDRLKQLYKNLLTSYYVFVGGVETLLSNTAIDSAQLEVPANDEVVIDLVADGTAPTIIDAEDNFVTDDGNTKEDLVEIDPFEFYVDFDDPIGDPLTDDDLYSN